MGDASYDMSPQERQEMIREFLTESDQHLKVLNEKLLESEAAIKKNQEMADPDLNAMFRAAHTIKGTASFIGLNKVVKLTHEMETILQRVQNHQMPLTAVVIDVLFFAFDVLETLFEGLRSHDEESGEIEESVGKIKAVLNADLKPAAAPAPAVSPEAEKSVEVVNKEPEVAVSKKGAIEERYLKQFLIETEQNIIDFNSRLLVVEKHQVRDTTEIVNEMFRIMHTLKGSAGIVNASEMVEVAHNMETILSFFREKKKDLDTGTVLLMFKGIDVINELWIMLRDKQTIDRDISGIVGELRAYNRELLQEPAQSASVLPSTITSVATAQPVLDFDKLISIHELNEEEVDDVVDCLARGLKLIKLVVKVKEGIPIRSMKVLLLQERLKKHDCHIIVVKPTDEVIDQTIKGDVGVGVLLSSSYELQEIRSMIVIDGVSIVSLELVPEAQVEPFQTRVAALDEVVAPEQNIIFSKGAVHMEEPIESKKTPLVIGAGATAVAGANAKTTPMELSVIKIDSKKLDNLMNLSGELVILRAQFARLVGLFGEDILQQKALVNTIETAKVASEVLEKEYRTILPSGANGQELQVRKMQKLIDEMINSVRELEKKAAKLNLVNRIHALDETTRSLGKISSDIQSGVMQTRMIPIEGVFTRFRRIVRDISKDLGKEVNLVVEGEETELDKKIVDSLGDPLTHMIRNAVDHGIEDKEARVAAGKPEVGTITLRAFHKGNNMCIEIADDGKGIDPEKLVAAALKKGLITQEQVSGMTEKDKFDLMFLPGLSTAQKVTGLSGRGVGMDVVKSMINSVNGTVDIETSIGNGTTFVLKIPLTLAIIQALLVYIGQETYAIPVEAVTEIVNVSPKEIYSIDGNPTVKIREHALSLVELEKVIELKGKQRDDSENRTMVIIHDGETQLGIIVDSLIGEDEIVIKSLTDHFAKVRGITGASILGDGRIALILDPIVIIKESK